MKSQGILILVLQRVQKYYRVCTNCTRERSTPCRGLNLVCHTHQDSQGFRRRKKKRPTGIELIITTFVTFWIVLQGHQKYQGFTCGENLFFLLFFDKIGTRKLTPYEEGHHLFHGQRPCPWGCRFLLLSEGQNDWFLEEHRCNVN